VVGAAVLTTPFRYGNRLVAFVAWRCSLAPGMLDVPAGRHLVVASVNARLQGRLYSMQFRRYVDIAPAP
jgi:hypothetical protein